MQQQGDSEPSIEIVALYKAPSPGMTQESPSGDSNLPERDLQVLRLIIAGLSDDEIGRELGFGANTVYESIQSILRHFGATSRTQAAVYAIKQGFGSGPADSA